MNSGSEDIIFTRDFHAERKHFYLEFRRNDRGEFLRITEEGAGKRNSIIIPSSGINDFEDTLTELLNDVDAAEE